MMQVVQLGIWFLTSSLLTVVQAAIRTEGTRFILYFTEGSQATYPARPLNIYVSTASPRPVTVDVTTPAWSHADAVNETIVVTSSSPGVIPIPPSVRSMEVGREGKAILVEGSRAISVFGLNPSQNQAGLFAVLPTAYLDKEYYFPSYTEFSLQSQGFMGIVTEHDLTRIQVSLPSALQESMAVIRGIRYGPGEVIKVGTLSKFEILEIRQDPNCPECDLSGSRIKTNKPVAVFSTVSLSSRLGAFGVGGDILVEQLVPVKLWGRTFVTMSSTDIANVNIVRVMSGEPNVTVYQSNMKTFTLDLPGQFQDIRLPPFMHLVLQATKPLQVVQFSSRSSPFMVLVTPVEHFTNSAQVPTITMDMTSKRGQINSIVLVARVCDTEHIYLNVTKVSQLSTWTNLASTGFAWTKLRIKGEGFHRIGKEIGGSGTSRDDISFGGFVYGEGEVTAYAAPLAMEGNKYVETFVWADPLAVSMHKANLLNKGRIRQQLWRLLERDFTRAQKTLQTTSAISPIVCFDQCRNHPACRYVSISRDKGRKFTCSLYDEEMICASRTFSPGIRTYVSRISGAT